MDYYHLPQEQNNFCLPACLQMILDSRGFTYQNQSSLYQECETGFLRNGLLEDFLYQNKYPLHCLDFYVRQSQLKEFEQLVDKGLKRDCNILVSVAYEVLMGCSKELNHTLIITEYDPHCDRIDLIDPAQKEGISCNFSTLMNAIFTVSGAFHLFHPDLSLLHDLKEKYF